MKTNLRILFLSIPVLFLVCGAEAYAQQGGRGRGGSGWGMQDPYARIYHPGTVETLAGEVLSVEKVTSTKGRSDAGVHLNLKTEKESVSVHLGPEWFLASQGLGIAVGERVEIQGSRVQYGGETVVIAAQVRRGETVLTLRSPSGIPHWRRGAGAGRGSGRANW